MPRYGQPAIVLAATSLAVACDLEPSHAADDPQRFFRSTLNNPDTQRAILVDAGLHDDTIAAVITLASCLTTGTPFDGPEWPIASDIHTIIKRVMIDKTPPKDVLQDGTLSAAAKVYLTTHAGDLPAPSDPPGEST